MSELAFSIEGEPFMPPAAATGWRVKRLRLKGAPEVVYDREGLPLVLPLDATMDELRAEGATAGRYRLDPVDLGGKTIANATPAYVFVHDASAAVRPAVPSAELASPSGAAAMNEPLIEAMRLNAQMAQSVIGQFAAVMAASAGLLRAADGAGLPAREPRGIAGDETDQTAADDEGESEPAPTAKTPLATLVAAITPALLPLCAELGPKLATALAGGSLRDLFDWQGAANRGKEAARAASGSENRTTSVTPPTPAPASTSPGGTSGVGLAAMAQLLAIQAQLAPDERAMVQALASELTPDERDAWIQRLAALPLVEAVAKVRAVLHGDSTATTSASPERAS